MLVWLSARYAFSEAWAGRMGSDTTLCTLILPWDLAVCVRRCGGVAQAMSWWSCRG